MKKIRMTKGQLESRISDAVAKFEKEYMEDDYKDIKTKIFQDHILIIIDGFLNVPERRLVDLEHGEVLFKEIRTALFEVSQQQLRECIQEIVDVRIVSSHWDVSTKTGEKIIVLTVDCNLEEYLT
ncbi:MAG: DUF2294 domain-containing protein [Firmicutes bacterium]|nr:DUF2294 domain-containing protein [Bacillota bacterium]